jgi:hypothetical protein
MVLRPTADAPPPEPLLIAYAEVSPDGADHFPVVIAKIARSVAEEPGLEPADLNSVTSPTLVVAADDDIVTPDHTLELYRNLPDAQLAIVPGTSHLLLHEKPELCTRLVTDFLTTGSTPTWMPIRRATPPAASDAPAMPVTATQPERHDPEQLSLPVGLSKPARRALAAAGYTTLEQLAQVSGADLGRMHGVGPKAIEQIRQALPQPASASPRRVEPRPQQPVPSISERTFIGFSRMFTRSCTGWATVNIDCWPPHSQMMMALVSSTLRAIARQTVAIAERGSYRTTPGDDVIIGDKLARAVADTRLYQPDDVLPAATSVSSRSTVEITNESSLAATRRLGGEIACRVFASARNPGGGFLNGAQAQEESLAA